MHPGYLSARGLYRKRNAVEGEWQKTQESEAGSLQKAQRHLHQVQHHEAHVASVIAEHHLSGNVLGFAFDGTGYGRDETIWGSEAFFWNGTSMQRLAHLKPVSLVGGDEGAKNADTILYGYIASFKESTREQIRAACGKASWYEEQRCDLVEKAVGCQINTITSSSMGRLFDAVSAFLDICHYNSYEGEAAIEVENLAATVGQGYALGIELIPAKKYSEAGDGAVEYLGDTEPLFLGMVEALKRGVSKAEIARGFLDAVSDFICGICDRGTRQIVLSGGTFQNRILLERTIVRLEERGYKVYINEQVPPGDGGLCLGQAYLCARRI